MGRISLRTRLIAAFLGVVFLSLSGISLILLLTNTRAAQQENERRLMTVGSYKSKAIQEWTGALTSELGSTLVGEDVNQLIEMVLFPQSTLGVTSAPPPIRTQLRNRLLDNVGRSRYYDEFTLLDMSGKAVLSSTRSHDGQDYSQEEFFKPAWLGPYVGTPTYSTVLNQTLLYAAYPIYGEKRALIGILAGRAKTGPLQDIFNDTTGFHEPGQTFLASLDGTVIAGSVQAWGGKQVTDLVATFPTVGKPSEEVKVASYTNINEEPVTGAYRALPQLRGMLVIEQTQRDFTRSQLATIMVDLSVMLSSILLALYISLLATRNIATPVTGLAEVAVEIAATASSAGLGTASRLHAAGEELQALTSGRGDEIGVMGNAFRQMTLQLAGLVGGLETMVNERTRQLATRSSYLEASADVGRVITSILDPERLIEQVVELIRDRFSLYYVGLFLADREGQWAVLRSGTGAAGRSMLARGHRLRIEPTSMIGWCIANAQARIAQQASQDEVRVATPELPETRSEAALPLRVRGQVIGAISVQSTQVDAFDQDSLAVLQTMADQLAIAIENAQLYAQSQHALEAERRAYMLSTESEWRDWLRLRAGMSVRSDSQGAITDALPSGSVWYPEMQQAYQERQIVQAGERLALPITVRGAVIGVINLTKRSRATAGDPNNTIWTNEEVTFLETIAEQLGVALDSARLYAETRQRAEQDRMVDEITSRMRATLDLRSVLETAAREMRDALGLAEVEVRLAGSASEGA